MVKRILLSIVMLVLIAYLAVAITAFNRKPADQTCRDMELVIKDTAYAGFITKEELKGILQHKGIYPIGKKMERISTKSLERELSKHPLIDEAECYKTPSGKVCVEVTQRIPILRVMSSNGQNYYLDNKGTVMPPDAKCVAHRVIVTGNVENSFAMYPSLYPQVLLTFLGVQYPSENKAVTEHILNNYSKSHPNILVSYEWVPLRTYPCILKKRICSNSLDDVFMLSQDSRYQVPEGVLADLSSLPTLAAYRQQVLAQMRKGDSIPYVTTSLGAFGLFCNLNMLERNRLKVPQTLEEFLAACAAFHRIGITPLAVTRECLRALLIARAYEPAVFGDANAFFHSQSVRTQSGIRLLHRSRYQEVCHQYRTYQL